MRRGPKRSAMAPVGICSPAYTASCAATKVASTDGPVWKRRSASSDATPRLVRWKTATKYALTASPHAAHGRPAPAPAPLGPGSGPSGARPVGLCRRTRSRYRMAGGRPGAVSALPGVPHPPIVADRAPATVGGPSAG